MIETNKYKIVIDPGTFSSEEETKKMKDVDFIFITHRHGDHFNEEIFNKIRKETTKIYSTKEVQENYKNTKFEIIQKNDILELEFGKARVVKAVHGYLPTLTKNNSEINENIGYIFEIENKRIYHPSDTIIFKNNYKCNILFAPVCNHGLVMGPFEAAKFAKETQAELVIPIHYDNPKYPIEINKVKTEFEKEELSYKILKIGEEIEF